MTRRTWTCATCRIEHTCTLSLVSSFDHSHHIPHGSRPLALVIHSIRMPSMCSVLWVPLHHLLLLPAVPLPLPFPDDRRWLLDNQQPARLRKRDLRHPGRLPPPHRLWAQRHGVHQRHGAQRRGLQQVHWLPGFPRPHCPFVRPLHGWRHTRQATRRCTPRLRRLPPSGRCKCQSVVNVSHGRSNGGTIGVKQLSYSQSLLHSVYDSAESIATPPDSDLEDEQLRKVLASPLYFREREENERQTQAYHSERESLMASSSRDLEAAGKLDAMFSCHNESSQNTFSERDRRNEPGNRCVHSVFRLADRANVGKSLLDGNKDHLLNQARSELVKQEHEEGSLNSCINELQQQTYAQRLELEDAHHGFFESRREHFGLQEELSMKGKVLRKTQIRNVHEMGKMKRITSRQILCTRIERKSWHYTEAHFTIAINERTDEFYECVRGISRSGIESQWEIVLRSQSTSRVSKFSFYAWPRQTLATWYMECTWITWKCFW